MKIKITVTPDHGPAFSHSGVVKDGRFSPEKLASWMRKYAEGQFSADFIHQEKAPKKKG